MAVLGNGTPLPAATARRLVIGGPYRFVRNPMAVAGLVQTVGVGLWTGSWTTVFVGFAPAHSPGTLRSGQARNVTWRIDSARTMSSTDPVFDAGYLC